MTLAVRTDYMGMQWKEQQAIGWMLEICPQCETAQWVGPDNREWTCYRCGWWSSVLTTAPTVTAAPVELAAPPLPWDAA